VAWDITCENCSSVKPEARLSRAMSFSHLGFTSALVRPEILKSKYTLSVILGPPCPDDDASSSSSSTSAATATLDQPTAAAVPATMTARLWMAAHKFREGTIITTGICAHRLITCARICVGSIPAPLLPDMLQAPQVALRKASPAPRVRTDSRPAPGTRKAVAVAQTAAMAANSSIRMHVSEKTVWFAGKK